MIYDLIIIGNGILSLSTAYEFRKINPTSKIGIIGKNCRMNGSSIAAGAMLNCFGEVTNCSLKFEPARTKLEMAIKALNMWDIWLDEINENFNKQDELVTKKGTFVILNSKSGNLDSENFSSMIKALDLYKEHYQEVEQQYIPGLNPVEDCRSLRSIYLPKEGFINPLLLLKKLEDFLILKGNIDFIDDNINQITYNNTINFIQTEKGLKLSAHKYLIAAGAYSQNIIDLIPELQNKIPRILSGVGYSILMEQQENKVQHVIRTPNRAGACGLHVLPYKDLLYVGASNNVAFSPENEPASGLIHFILECVIEQINQEHYKSRIKKINVGNRPATLDTYPLIGQTSISNLWILTGTYRDGFHQSPLLSKHIANLLSDKEGLFNNIFNPERKLIKTFTKAASIDEGIVHYVSGAFERGIKLPKAGWDIMLKDLIKKRIKDLYFNLESDYGLSPDMLMMFEFEEKLQTRINFFKDYLKNIS